MIKANKLIFPDDAGSDEAEQSNFKYYSLAQFISYNISD